jgi:hypothetical protein
MKNLGRDYACGLKNDLYRRAQSAPISDNSVRRFPFSYGYGSMAAR